MAGLVRLAPTVELAEGSAHGGPRVMVAVGGESLQRVKPSTVALLRVVLEVDRGEAYVSCCPGTWLLVADRFWGSIVSGVADAMLLVEA